MLMHATHMYFKYKHILKLLNHKPAVHLTKWYYIIKQFCIKSKIDN